MKKNIKYFMMAAVALLSMSACNNEMDEQDSANNGKLQPVQFQMSFASTRTTTGDETAGRATTWKAGDAIGIFAYPAGSTTNAVATNFKYILGNDGNWTATGSEIYPDQALDYYAYYPYQDGITDPAAINVAALTDQSKTDESSYAASDILASKTSNVAAGNGKVTLAFSHMFAMVEVKVQGDLITQKPTKVELLGVKLNAELNLTATTPVATQKADATAQDVTMFCLENPNTDSKVYSFRAAVPAQEIAASTPLVRIYAPDAASKTYTMQHTAAVSYNAGQFRQMIVNIGSKRVVLIIPASDTSINPWTPSDAINGDGSAIAENLVTIPVSSLTSLTQYTTTTEYNNGTGANATDHWYSQTDVVDTKITVELIDDIEYTKAIKIQHTNPEGAWYKGSLGFHHSMTFKSGLYKLTFKAKASNKQQIRVLIRSSFTGDPDGDGAIKESANWFFTVQGKNLANAGITITGDNQWYDCETIFDFNRITSNTGGSENANTIATATELTTAYNNLELRFVPNKETLDPHITYTITNIKLEEYTQP